MHHCTDVLVLALAWLLAAPVAGEQPSPPRVGILPLRGSVGLSEADRDHLRARSHAALLGPRVRVADDAEIASAEAREDHACRQRSLAPHGVTYWLTLSVTRGVTRSVDVRLTHPEPPGRLHRPLAIGALAAAAVSIGVGAALVAADGEPLGRRCGSDDPASFDTDGDCRYVHETLGAGVAVTALGGGLASAAATLLIIDASRRARRTKAWARRMRLHVGPGRVGISGAF